MTLINISYGNYATREKIVAVLKPGPAPLRRLIREAKDDHRLIDATWGKKTRTVLVMDSGHILLSAATPETVFARYEKNAVDLPSGQINEEATEEEQAEEE